MPFATELLVKDLTMDWDDWKRTVPIWTLASYGWQKRYRPGETPQYVETKDPRAGDLLHRVAELGSDEKLAGLAAFCLDLFATPELLQRVEAARDRAVSEKARQRCVRAAATMAVKVREYNLTSAAPGTRPAASVPAAPQ